LIALIAGQLVAFFIIGLLLFIGGVVAISIYLDSRSKIAALNAAASELHSRVLFHEANQTKLVQLANGYRTNFETLVDEEKAELRAVHDAITAEARSDRETAAHELEAAIEQSTAAEAISQRLLTEVRKSIKSKLTPNNYATQKERFMKTVAFCERKGHAVDQETIDDFERQLKSDYEEAVRKEQARIEQARIKERIREEQRAERELERELKKAEAERKAIEKAIQEALERTHDEHSAEVELLRAKLAEAEARSQRAVAMAQLTKAGYVYVISNLGSFGDDVFKIGLTRRLEPLDRVKELGDASVPFPFDVHMMISSDDAPALEARLHRMFNDRRVNRVNLRKEFFKVSIEEIAEAVKECHGEVEYTATPEALEYNESLSMSEEDFAFVSSQVDPETLPED